MKSRRLLQVMMLKELSVDKLYVEKASGKEYRLTRIEKDAVLRQAG